MSEETLNKLFEQARTEVPETNLGEIQKWIGLGGASLLTAALLTKLKLLVTLKPFIMITSAIVTIGIGAGAVLMMNKSEKPVPEVQTAKTTEMVERPSQKAIETPVVEQKQERKINIVMLEPLTQLMEEWKENAILPVLETMEEKELFVQSPYPEGYCLSLPNDDNTDYGFFNALKISGGVDVVLIQGEECGVRLEGNDMGKECTVIKNNNKTLEIYLDCKDSKWKGEGDLNVTVYVTVQSLEKISSSGATTIQSQNQLTFQNLTVVISGASELELDMKGTNLNVNASGASDISLKGDVDKIVLVNSGASEFEAGDLKVKKAEIECSGASEVTLNVSDNLDMKVSGASEVEYSGSPVIGKESVTGASSVKKK